MKPETGLNDMDEKVYDPRTLFAEVGLLITEARTPELSKKGRVEGPHCPPISGLNEHECDRHKEQCRKASDIIHQQEILWQNKIPMRIDVLLFPDCKHGQFESTVIEGASLPLEENFELLERWDVQLVKKRSPERMDGCVKGRIHLQAVRSYLHFSQLSSWLISMGGAIPLKTVYRIYAPGESVGPSFSRLPEVHNFPSADLGDVIMRTTCAYLPRQKDPMVLLCRTPSLTFEPCRRNKKIPEEDVIHGTRMKSREPAASTSKYADEMDKRMKKQKKLSLKDQQEEHSKKMDCQVVAKPPYVPRSNIEGQLKGKVAHSIPCPVSITPKRKVDQVSPSAQQLNKNTDEGQRSRNMNTSDIAIATKSSVIQAPLSTSTNIDLPKPAKYSDHVTPTKATQLRKPVSLNVAMGNAFPASKRLPSPKVLVTGSAKPQPSMYKKRCLDLEKPESIMENDKEYDNLSKISKITASDICDLIKPPSLGELEAYLSSLSNKAPCKQRIEDIPTTKCSFYLDDDDSEGVNDNYNCNQFSMDDTGYFSNSSNLYQTQSLSERADCQTPTMLCELKEEKHVKTLFIDTVTGLDVDDRANSQPLKSQPQKISRPESTNIVHTNITTSKSKLRDSRNNDIKETSEAIKPSHGVDLTSSGSCEVEGNAQSCLSLEVEQRTSKVQKTLHEISIPCNIGAVDDAMATLAQNLDSMDIDDRPYSPFSRNSSPTLDHEVERHLSPKFGGVRTGEFGRGSDQMGGSLSTTPTPESCDTNSPTRGLSLCKQLLKKEFQQNVQKEMTSTSNSMYKSLPSPDDIKNFQFMINRSASVVFNSNTGLPSRSSPAPIKKISSNKFDYDCSLTNVKAIKNAISCSKLTLQSEDNTETIEDPKIISTSAPATTNCLLGNFEESVLNGRIEPVGVVDGFSVEIGAGGTFCPKHVSLPVAAYFFQLSDDNAPSPYLGHVNLEPLGRRGYHIPRTGTVQITLFNPNKTVVKMFVVMYDMSDMPANCQTFLRQRTLYMPVDSNSSEPSFLRYLIHLRFQSSKSGKIYLHTDIRLIFARDKFEFDPRVANYELRSFTEGPENPKFSPKK